MKIRPLGQSDIISIEKIVVIQEDEDESLGLLGDLEAGIYALDSTGRLWRQMEAATGLIAEFTEQDNVGKRRRAKRAS